MADDATFQLTVRRVDAASIVEVGGEVTAASEDAQSDAHQRAGDVSAVVLDFSKLSYMKQRNRTAGNAASACQPALTTDSRLRAD